MKKIYLILEKHGKALGAWSSYEKAMSEIEKLEKSRKESRDIDHTVIEEFVVRAKEGIYNKHDSIDNAINNLKIDILDYFEYLQSDSYYEIRELTQNTSCI